MTLMRTTSTLRGAKTAYGETPVVAWAVWTRVVHCKVHLYMCCSEMTRLLNLVGIRFLFAGMTSHRSFSARIAAIHQTKI